MPTLYQLGYDPPYDSPIEETLAWSLTKQLGDSVELLKQEEVETPYGAFRLDLVAKTKSGRMIAFECDGKEYHIDTFRDRCRDALILAMDKQAAIYRFRGQDLYYRMDDCLYVIAQKDPGLFSPTGLRNIELLASDEVKSAVGVDFNEWALEQRSGYERGNTLKVYYKTDEKRPMFTVVVERRAKDEYLIDADVLAFLNFALDNDNTTFNDVYHRYLNRPKKG